ncbi:hypothetical protein [Azospirillum himalayense]|uniref:Uncharacterized protein n=1 Tax=Azospirillum himalayense TaxID=654847 RepID=A0ABW0FY21_9PROT
MDEKSYVRMYRRLSGEYADDHASYLCGMIRSTQRNSVPALPYANAAIIDAATDELMKRGMCADVLNWFREKAP